MNLTVTRTANQFRLESLHRRQVLILYLAYFILVIMAMLIGYLGPDPYKRRPSEGHDMNHHWTSSATEAGLAIKDVVSNLKHVNSEWWFFMTPMGLDWESMHDTKKYYEFLLVYNVSITFKRGDEVIPVIENVQHTKTVQCWKGTGCLEVLIANRFFLDGDTVEMDIFIPYTGAPKNELAVKLFETMDTVFWYTSYKFFTFEIAFRYTYCFLSMTALAIFAVMVTCLQHGTWFAEQRCVGLLLLALVFFNNPLFAAEVYVPTWVFPTLSVVFFMTYLVMFLFVVLCITHAILLQDKPVNWPLFFIPKIVLLFVLWLILVLLYTWSKRRAKTDPSDSDISSTTHYEVYYTISAILLVLYLFWILYLVCRIAGDWSNMKFYSNRFKSIWGLTICVVFFTAACVVLFAYHLYSASEFLTIFTVYNLYTYLLAFMFAPSPHYETIVGQHDALDEDSDEAFEMTVTDAERADRAPVQLPQIQDSAPEGV